MNNILIPVFLIIIISMSYYFTLLHYKRICRKDLFKRYGELHNILERAKETAYTKLFRDQFAVFLSSGYKMGRKELYESQPRYLKVVFQICGPKIIKELKEMYGDVDSFSIILVNSFVEKLEKDEQIFIDIAEKTTEEKNQAKTDSNN